MASHVPALKAPSKSTSNAFWQWTYTPQATAPCFVRDVFEMKDSGIRDADFYWLGRVPCRTVKLLGLLVGVKVKEQQIVYDLDDGTGAIECLHKPGKGKSKSSKPEALILRPFAPVGASVVIQGRITVWSETRRIIIDSISRCPSANDEPAHWIAVRKLHETYYDLKEPFVIPERQHSQPPQTPSTSKLPNTPSTNRSYASSPTKSSSQSSPHRLRHPSRLHTIDLTENSFRIYLKHYMDNADVLVPRVLDPPSTPTKTSRNRIPLEDKTPRPNDMTPRRIIPLDFSCALPVAPVVQGFTLSYLRRVPELRLMAKRVVKAEAKRRAREAKKRAREKGKVPPPAGMAPKDQQKLHPRMKRLFLWAIRQLVNDGDIASWQGPTRPCPDLDVIASQADTSGLWKMSSSHSTVGVNSTMFSNASVTEDDEDEGVLSDPMSDEEGFVAMTTAFVSDAAEKAIRTLLARAATRRPRATGRGLAPVLGPTTPEIFQFLKNKEETWRTLTQYILDESLAFLKDEGRAWNIGGRWELSV